MIHNDSIFETFDPYATQHTEFLTFEGIEEFPHFEAHGEGSEEPEEIFSVFFELSDSRIEYSRDVYAFMDLLRDLGGLRGALVWVLMARTHAYSRVWFNNSFLNNNFEYLNKDTNDDRPATKRNPKVHTT